MGKGGPKVEVNKYFMAQHMGICAQADAVLGIIIKEKRAWSGRVSTQSEIVINRQDLFGGALKEGGVAGVAHFLPGDDDQLLTNVLATRLGRANGADCPGFRGLAGMFFTGPLGTQNAGNPNWDKRVKGKKGFYWTANNPYLPGVWITVERAPKGLTQTYARIPRLGSNFYPFELTTTTEGIGGTMVFGASDAWAIYANLAGGMSWYSLDSRERVSNVGPGAAVGSTASAAIDSEGNAYMMGVQLVPTEDFLYIVGAGGGDVSTLSTDSPNWEWDCTRALEPDGGDVQVFTSFLGASGTEGHLFGPDYQITTGKALRDACLTQRDDDSDIVMGLWQPVGGGTDFILQELVDGLPSGTAHTITGLVSRSGFTDARLCHVSTSSHWFITMDGKYYAVDDTSFTIKKSGDATAFTSTPVLPAYWTTRRAFWSGNSEYSLGGLDEDGDETAGDFIRTINTALWTGAGNSGFAYDPYNHALWSRAANEKLVIRELDRGNFDANPAHIIFECLTNTDWGMGSPETAIDVDSFEAAGVTLYDEDFGLSMIWTRQASIQDFIKEILDHIQAVLFVDPATGLLTLKLIRGDYDPDDLDEINPSNATLSNFGRKLWGEITNEVVVTWTNPDNEQDETVVVQDLASIVTQGGIVSDGRNYYGVRNSILAQRLAQRDLRSSGAPLATWEAEVDRTLWLARPASVYKTTWPEYGLAGVIGRVTDVNYGKPGDPTIKLTFVEDVFGLDVGSYVEPPGSVWEDPSSAPSPMEEVQILTLPYFLAVRSPAATFVESPDYPEVIAGLLASTDNTDTFNYELWDQVALPDSSLEWQALATENVIGRAELVTAWEAEAETVFDEDADLTEIFGQTSPTQGGFILLGDGAEEDSEIALVTAAGSSVTVSRGVLDTVPKAWPPGTPVWFVDGETLFYDPLVRSAAEIVSYKLLPRTSQGQMSLSLAPLETATLTERPWLPSRPANVTIDGVQFNSSGAPVDMVGEPDVTVTWSNRNRLTEDSVVMSWTDGDVTPETGQTTAVTIYGADGVTVLDTITGLGGATYDIPLSSFAGASLALVRLSSERTDGDGTFASLQAHGLWVQVGAITFDQTGITWDADTVTWDEG